MVTEAEAYAAIAISGEGGFTTRMRLGLKANSPMIYASGKISSVCVTQRSHFLCTSVRSGLIHVEVSLQDPLLKVIWDHALPWGRRHLLHWRLSSGHAHRSRMLGRARRGSSHNRSLGHGGGSLSTILDLLRPIETIA